MASPDVSHLIDLTLYDKTPVEIAAEAVEYAQTVLPEFSPRTGTVEDAIIQSTARMTYELVGAINRMTPGVLEVVLQLFSIPRITGTLATGTIAITLADSLGHEVPAGTAFGYLDNSDPENPVLFGFTTDAELIVDSGFSSGSVAITGTTFEQYPELSSGQSLQLLTPVSFVSSGQLDSDLLIGADPETDAEFFSRASAKLNSYTEALVLTTQMEHYILTTYSDVYRCKAYSRVNSTNDDWVDAAENGYVTIYTSRVGGASLSAGVATIIQEDVADRSTAGLSIAIKAPLLVTIPITTTITVKSGWSAIDAQANLLTALNSYLHPDYWGWGQTIYYNELISLIDQVAGVDRVVALTIDGATVDYSFTRRGTLPTHSTTITIG